MKKDDKFGERLNTRNYAIVHSRAAKSFDYNKTTIEIEYSDGDIYHYMNYSLDDLKLF